MTVDRIHNLTLPQIPDLYRGIIWRWSQEVAIRMERDRVHCINMSIVMLQQSLWSTIEDLDFVVGGARCKASAIRVEFNLGDHSWVVLESMYNCLSSQVPELNCSIITTWCNHPWVHRELRASDPILMASQGLLEFQFLYVPYFYKFVIWCRDQHWSISIELNTFDRGCMALHDSAVGTGVVIPYSNWGVSRARGYQVTLGVDRDITDWTSMPYKLIWSSIWA